MGVYRQWVACAALVSSVCALLVLSAGAAAAAGVLSGRVSKLPAARGLSFADAYAIDPDSGDVAQTGAISHAAFRLSLPPGPYLPAVAAQSERGKSYVGFGAAVTLRAGATARAGVKVSAVSSDDRAALAAIGGPVRWVSTGDPAAR